MFRRRCYTQTDGGMVCLEKGKGFDGGKRFNEVERGMESVWDHR